MAKPPKNNLKVPTSLRRKILTSVVALILLSLLGSTISLYRISEVNRSLDSINKVSIPLGKLLTQLQSDVEVFSRELERRLGSDHWTDRHWKPKPIPKWIQDLIENELVRVNELISRDVPWWNNKDHQNWIDWSQMLLKEFTELRQEAVSLYLALDEQDDERAAEIYPRWISKRDQWLREVHNGIAEYEKAIGESFSVAESRVSQLKTGLEIILAVVVLLSLLLLWLGERALRPLTSLTSLARQIAIRGLQKEDKARVPEMSISRFDEVSQLTREFHHMATSLLEREKTVETQKQRLQEQNRLLLEMGALQERLRKAENLAAVGRMSAQVAHEVRNPLHSIGLEAEMALERACKSRDHNLKESLQSILLSVDRLAKITENYLKLSKLSSGEKSLFDLGDLLDTVLATYASQCQAKGVEVDWSRQADQPLLVLADRGLLEQAIGNLFKNALQAADERKPRICCKIGSAESGRVWFRIEDNGSGVPFELREKLFTPFVTTKAQGTGLGLSFVKKVVEDHSGQVSLVDNCSENGACFEILLPCATFITGNEASLGDRVDGEDSLSR